MYLIAADVALARGEPAQGLSLAEQALRVYTLAETVEPGRRERALVVATQGRELLEQH